MTVAGPVRLGVAAALVDGGVVAGDVEVVDGQVAGVGLRDGRRGEGIAVPGFVDWQVNGFGGVHFGTADAEGYRAAGGALARAGIVWAAPTLFSLPVHDYVNALEVLAGVRATDPDCGFTRAHLEGPFMAPDWRGAHRVSTFLDGDPAVLDRLLGTGAVGLVTLAPERPGVMALVPRLSAAGVVVSVGHTDATAEQCRAAAAAGASAQTHCWNAHRRFAPRDPGPAGWALSASGVTVGLIADGIHVAPEVLALTFAAAVGRVAVTTDAIAPAGTDVGEWSDYGQVVTIAGGCARLADGTLAGSVTTPTQMLGVLTRAGVSFAGAVHAMSAPQARSLGLGDFRLRPGDAAHVTVLAEDHSVLQAWRSGERVA